MARDKSKSQRSPWTTLPVTQVFDSFMAIQPFLFDSSARRRRIWRRALCAQSTSPGSQRLQFSHSYSILQHEGEGSGDARYALSLRLRILSHKGGI